MRRERATVRAEGEPVDCCRACSDAADPPQPGVGEVDRPASGAREHAAVGPEGNAVRTPALRCPGDDAARARVTHLEAPGRRARDQTTVGAECDVEDAGTPA